MASNPLRNLITELIFKGYSIFVQIEQRTDTGSQLIEHLISPSNYNTQTGWQAGVNGLVRNEPTDSPFESLYLPYHRVRRIRHNTTSLWNSDDPKKIPSDLPLAVEPRA